MVKETINNLTSTPPSLFTLFRMFFVIGSTSFGGFMALIAMIRKNIVERSQLLSDDTLMESVAIASVLPGPVAVNVVAFVGYKLRGIVGAAACMVAVLLPSFGLVCLLAFAYINLGTSYSMTSLLIGTVPAVAAIILSVSYSLVRKEVKGLLQVILLAASFAFSMAFPGYRTVITILASSAIIGILFMKPPLEKDVTTRPRASGFPVVIIASLIILLLISASVTSFTDNILFRLLSTFSGVSLTLFGGGYVMVPMLKALLVDQLAWLSYDEFAFGISVGQITPGPILISAAFFGYKVSGFMGAVIATMAIFLPSALLMILVANLYSRISEYPGVKAMLRGMKPAIIGMIIYSAVSLMADHLAVWPPWLSLVILLISAIGLIRFGIHSALIVIFGCISGMVLNAFGG